MFLWASYQIGNAVIVMNLLIALMNATISSIQEDKVNQWLYARTQVYPYYSSIKSKSVFFILDMEAVL